MTKELAEKIADLKATTRAILSIGYRGDERLAGMVCRAIDNAVKYVLEDYEEDK